MKTIHYLQIVLFVIILAALSCARQTAPTGGPKDSIPPTVTRIIPQNQEINFQGKQIEATFSEAVQLNNPKEQIIITPGVGKDFQATVRKNKVVITLTNPLQPNTTYTVNFREAVQDLTEKNPAENVRLAFSTGSYIDSLHISGTTYELLTSKDGKDATIGLYEQDTFSIFKHKPAYFAKTDPQGNFHIDNLKPGNYRVYAWLDNNKNLVVDSKSEPYGFLPDIIQPLDSTPPLSIPYLKIDTRPLKLTSARPNQTYFNLKTSKSTAAFYLTSEQHAIYAGYGDDTENIRVYNTMNLHAGDSIAVLFTAHDSLDQTIDTTLYLKFSQRAIKPLPFQFNTDVINVSANTGLLNATITFNKPVYTIHHDTLYYRIDTTLVVPITPTDIQFDTTRTKLTINKTLDRKLLQPPTTIRTPASRPTPTQAAPRNDRAKPAQKKVTPYELVIGKSTFISAEGDTSKATSITAKPTTMETTGVIILSIQTKQRPLLAQLLSKGKVIAQQSATNKATFSDLTPGDYAIRVVVDKNDDKRWTPSNILRNQPAEPIYFYKNEQGQPNITLKANWERELLITF